VEKEVKSYRPIKALFYLPLSAGLILAALLALFIYAPQFSLSSFKHSTSQKETL
jgi:hypothetical protein